MTQAAGVRDWKRAAGHRLTPGVSGGCWKQMKERTRTIAPSYASAAQPAASWQPWLCRGRGGEGAWVACELRGQGTCRGVHAGASACAGAAAGAVLGVVLSRCRAPCNRQGRVAGRGARSVRMPVGPGNGVNVSAKAAGGRMNCVMTEAAWDEGGRQGSWQRRGCGGCGGEVQVKRRWWAAPAARGARPC